MSQLIRKGGFRERANRGKCFTASENQMTTLTAHDYSSAKATEATTIAINQTYQAQQKHKNTEMVKHEDAAHTATPST